MTVESAFKVFPKASEVWTVGSEVFLKQEEAAEYSRHFNLGQPARVERPKVEKAEKKAEVKKTETADTEAEKAEGTEKDSK